jgi:serine/threonine protein kinase
LNLYYLILVSFACASPQNNAGFESHLDIYEIGGCCHLTSPIESKQSQSDDACFQAPETSVIHPSTMITVDKADIFSLGKVLIMSISLDLFNASLMMQTMTVQMLPMGWPPQFQTLLLSMIALSPTERPSYQQVMAIIVPLLQGADSTIPSLLQSRVDIKASDTNEEENQTKTTTPKSTEMKSATSTSIASGWSTLISEYQLLEQLVTFTGGGTSSTTSSTKRLAYRAQLSSEARSKVIDHKSLASNDFLLTFHSHEPNDLLPIELEASARLPAHDNILSISHWFIISSSVPTLPFTATNVVVMITELTGPSLQDVINYRTESSSPTSSSSSSSPQKSAVINIAEASRVVHDISSALCHLQKYRIAHLDIKPSNIVIRLPTGVTHQQAFDNLALPGLSFVLTNFGILICPLSSAFVSFNIISVC